MGDSATVARNSICLSGLAADLWPHSARLEADGDISIGGLRLSALAARYGTPAYILDEADVRDRCRAYADALPGEIAYASRLTEADEVTAGGRDHVPGLDGPGETISWA